MRLKVRLLMSFKEYGLSKLDKDGVTIVAEGMTLGGFLDYLGIPPDLPKNILINKKDQNDLHMYLSEGDEIVIYSLICGG